MKASYDPEVDALSIRWSDTAIEESDEVESGFILDYDQEGNVVGVEILDASTRIKNLSTAVATNAIAHEGVQG